MGKYIHSDVWDRLLSNKFIHSLSNYRSEFLFYSAIHTFLIIQTTLFSFIKQPLRQINCTSRDQNLDNVKNSIFERISVEYKVLRCIIRQIRIKRG